MSALAPLQLIPTDIANVIRGDLGVIAALLVLYVLAFLVITGYARRRLVSADVTDFAVASRTLGVLVTTLTLFATISSGVGLLGFPGTMYVVGIGLTVTAIFGFAIAAVLVWYFGRRIWLLGEAYDFVTPGDLLGVYYGSDLMRVYAVVASVLFNVVFLVAQLLAGGILVHVLTGGIVPIPAALVAVAAIIALHVMFSGMRGIAWFDMLNGTVIFVVIAIYFVAIILHAGSLTAALQPLGDLRAAHITLPGPVGAFPPLFIYGTIIGLILGTAVMSPAAWMRFYATDGRANFTRIGIGIAVLLALVNIFGYYQAAYGRALFPDLQNPDFVATVLAFEVMPVPLAGLFLIGILAAIVSTSDSYLHSLSTMITRDFVKAIFRDDLSERREVQLTYVVVALSTVAALVLAIAYRGLILPLAVFAGAFAVQLMPALFGAVSWPRASNEAALVATPVGIVLVFVWELGLVPNPLGQFGLRGLFLAFIVNVVLFVGVSYLTSPPEAEKVEQFHGYLQEHLHGDGATATEEPAGAPADD